MLCGPQKRRMANALIGAIIRSKNLSTEGHKVIKKMEEG
jgi:hypothetical protein